MSETQGFDRIEAASRVREVIKKVAQREISIGVPSPNVGRVMSVDLPRLRATVWFPNDDQPIEVKLLSSVIPGDWQHRQSGRGAYDSLSGYGSKVVVQRINNSLYVTEVLTGGQFSFDLRTMNHSIVAQKATPTSAGNTNTIEPIVDQPLETFINCRVTDTSLGSGQALEFGPFTQYYAGPPGIGTVEVSVAVLPNRGQKTFRFVVNPVQEFDHPGSTGILDSWFRILPEHTITDSDGTFAGASDFDFDISYKRTAYGNTDDYSGYPEIWFRIYKRYAWPGGLDALIAIRATNIQKARALGGRELFMQEKRTAPAEIHGYLGFHNSKHLFRDTDDYAVFDNFGRLQPIVGAGWGNSDSGQTWVGTTNLWVDGASGVMGATAAAQTLTAKINSGITDFEATWVVWVDQMPTGAEFQTEGLFRFLDQNNKYSLKVVFDLAGVLKLSFIETFTGTSNFIGSDVTLPFTYTAGMKIRVRMKMEGNAIYGKVWQDGTREPEAWTKTGSAFNIAGGAAYGYGFQVLTGGANNNVRPSNIHFSDVKVYYQTPVIDNAGAQWHTGPWRGGLLRLANDVQKSWTYSLSGIRWFNDRLKWGTIFLHGPGPHRNGLSVGRANLTMPPSGRLIPVLPDGTTITVTSDGINIPPEHALYVGIPPGADWRDLDRNLFLVNGQSGREYQLPEWAVLIASRGPAGNAVFDLNAVPELRLGNGSVLDKWRDLAFRAGWSNYDPANFPNAQYRMEANNVVRCRGMFKANAAVSTGPQSVTGVFADMPQFWSPVEWEIFHVISAGVSTGQARIDIHPDGAFETPLQANGGGALYISLTGVSWVAG